MNLIVAIDEKNGLGKNGDLLCHIPSDLKHFKEITSGHTVIMGYNTLISLPKSKPLPNRTNIVLYENDIEIEGATVCHSLEELLDFIKDMDTEDIFVIGGAMVYALMMPYCNRLYITHMKKDFDADRFLPEIKKSEWKMTESSEPVVENGVEYFFATYERR